MVNEEPIIYFIIEQEKLLIAKINRNYKQNISHKQKGIFVKAGALLVVTCCG